MVQLAFHAPVANPSFSHSHSLRFDDIGWGFDRDGCISMSVSQKTVDLVHKSSVYVQQNVHVLEEGL